MSGTCWSMGALDRTTALATAEAAGREARTQARAARRAESRSATARSARERGRLARRRGRDFERRVAEYLGGSVVPGSGAYGAGSTLPDLQGDVRVGDWQVQCKHTAALATQRRWLDADGSDILVQADPGEQVGDALAVMRLSVLQQLLAGGIDT